MTAGQAVRFVAVARDSVGVELADRPISWHSSDSTRLLVLPSGLVVALDSGHSIVRATSEGHTAELAVTVGLLPVGSAVTARSVAADLVSAAQAVVSGLANETHDRARVESGNGYALVTGSVYYHWTNNCGSACNWYWSHNTSVTITFVAFPVNGATITGSVTWRDTRWEVGYRIRTERGGSGCASGATNVAYHFPGAATRPTAVGDVIVSLNACATYLDFTGTVTGYGGVNAFTGVPL
jgi:hypothetical protein